MPMTARQMGKLLEKNGYKHIKGGKGSHQHYYNSTTNITVVVPQHPGDLSKFVENKILKQTGLSK